jgi:hypothetical protein
MQILKANIQRLTCLNPAAKKCRDVLLYAIGLNDVLINFKICVMLANSSKVNP